MAVNCCELDISDFYDEINIYLVHADLFAEQLE